MKELNTNQIIHKIEVKIDMDKIKEFIEKTIKTKIEGKIKNISTYQYSNCSEIEFTIKSIKEDRLKELVYDVKKSDKQ